MDIIGEALDMPMLFAGNKFKEVEDTPIYEMEFRLVPFMPVYNFLNGRVILTLSDI